MYSHVSLFAGLGGFIMAGDRKGFRSIFANDIEKSCVLTLKQTFKDLTVSSRDIRELDVNDYAVLSEDVDVLSAGFPCQPFSVAGEKQGFSDERGQLFFKIPAFCSALRRYPKVLLLENVPMLKLFDNGANLATVIHELRKIGYWVSETNSKIIDCYDFGFTAQRRERLYIVAVHSSYFRKNKFRFPSPQETKPKVDLWSIIDRTSKGAENLYLDPDNKYARMIINSAKKNGENRLFQVRRTEVRACPENVCPTLTANMGGGGHNVPFLIDQWGVRRLSVEETLRLQCIRPDEVSFPLALPENSKLTMVGNSVCVDMVESIFENIRQVLEEVYSDDFEGRGMAVS